MSLEKPIMNSDSEISKKEQLQPTPISLGEKIETLIADLVGLLVRYARTVVVFSLMPVRAALTLCLQPIDYRKILRPFTFLLFGCMLFSFLLGASTYFDKSKFTTYVLEIVKNRLVEFSFTGLLVRSIPLVIITSLFATFASVLSRTSGEILKMLLAYLYGLQGNLIFIFVLAMPPLGDAFQALGRPDDDLIPTFFLLILALGVQGFRVFRLVINATEERFKVRVLLILFFPIFFLAPLPLTGYVVMKTGLIQDEVKLESPESRLAPVRIIEAKDTKIEQNSVHMILTALVHNQSKLPFILTQSEIHLELYLVLSIDLNNTEFWQLDRRTLPYLDCFDLNILSIKRMQAIFRNPKEIPFVILPEAAKMIKVKIEAEGSSAYFRKRKVWDNEGQLIHQSVKKIDKPWDELAEDRSLIFRLILLDPTSNKELVSDYFRVQRTKKKTRAIRIP